MTVENVQGSSRLLGEVNVTPMIDILLVLLIIFMVISPVVPRGLNAKLPQRSANVRSIPEAPIVVEIMKARNGLPGYKINRQDVSVEQLEGRLSSIFAMRAGKTMFVKAEADLDFSTIATVMDIGKDAGADRIGLLTSNDPL
jgi:biopolymer transport protein ExbD